MRFFPVSFPGLPTEEVFATLSREPAHASLLRRLRPEMYSDPGARGFPAPGRERLATGHHDYEGPGITGTARPGERQPALHTANSVVEALRENAREDPARPCLLFEGATMTYGELLDGAESFARAVTVGGLARGDRVALYLANNPNLLLAHLGTHLAGGVVVPVNPAYRRGELAHVLSDSGASVCVTDAERRPELENVQGGLSGLREVVEAGEGPLALPSVDGAGEPPLPRPDELAVISYTSGTTGRSKGAMLTHGNLVSNARAICEAWRWTAEDHLLLTLPLFHTHGLMVGVHGTLCAGASMELHRRFDDAAVYERLLGGGFTMFFGVPTMYSRLLREARGREDRPPPLRLYVAGSAALSPNDFEAFERRFGARILERYGMTETGMNLTNPYDGERVPGTVGMPFPGQEARVVGLEDRQPVPAGEVGEIEVRGPNVFVGYWQNAEATRESFTEDGWFRTGDLGFMGEDGRFTITGRAKELIVSGGYNVYPREVEEVIERHPDVAEVAVVGRPDEEYGERVVAFVVPEGDEPDAQGILDLCRRELAGYKRPREVVYLEELPRNAMGKVTKRDL
jgi:malonyl-CoA/methylmalonyl-CoA synthetase